MPRIDRSRSDFPSLFNLNFILMRDRNGQNLTYDYAKLDEHQTKTIDPHYLDQYFHGLHPTFTRVLQHLVCTGELQDLAFMPEESQVRH